MQDDRENLSGLFWDWFLCHVSFQRQLHFKVIINDSFIYILY